MNTQVNQIKNFDHKLYNLKFESSRHTFHIVTDSWYPIGMCLGAGLLLGSVAIIFGYKSTGDLPYLGVIFGLVGALVSFFGWTNDILTETSMDSPYTKKNRKAIILGFLLFLFTEILFFAFIFGSFLYYAGNLESSAGRLFPTFGIPLVDPLLVPMLNTGLLVSSSATATVAHILFKKAGKDVVKTVMFWLTLTVGLGLIFVLLQAYEYISLPAESKDGTFIAIFYLATGFHGLHVIVGVINIGIQVLRLRKNQFIRKSDLGLHFSLLYWHFVDVVWIFLMILVYFWGGYQTIVS